MYKSSAASVVNTIAPSVVQGGTLGKAGSGSSSSTGSSTSSGASSKPTNAGVEARGGVKWALLAITGLVAVGFGSLIV